MQQYLQFIPWLIALGSLIVAYKSYSHNIRYSGDHYPNDHRMMYSGHSLKDRMVAKLEEMYDDVKNDHERQMLDTWMRRLTSD